MLFYVQWPRIQRGNLVRDIVVLDEISVGQTEKPMEKVDFVREFQTIHSTHDFPDIEFPGQYLGSGNCQTDVQSSSGIEIESK